MCIKCIQCNIYHKLSFGKQVGEWKLLIYKVMLIDCESLYTRVQSTQYLNINFIMFPLLITC